MGPPADQKSGVSPTFSWRVGAQAEFYFREILPRHIDRDFRGQGYLFLTQMLAAHDAGDPTRILREHPAQPSERAMAMANGARATCPFEIQRGDGRLLGQFTLNGTYRNSMGTSETLWEARRVFLYEAAFERLPEEAIDGEILLTLFHEYIHHFESFYGARHQPLAAREQRREHVRLTAEQARRSDTWAIWKSRLGWGAAAALAIGLIAALTIDFRSDPPVVVPPDTSVPVKRHTREELHRLLEDALLRGEPNLREALEEQPFLDSAEPPQAMLGGGTGPTWTVEVEGRPVDSYLCWMPEYSDPTPVCIVTIDGVWSVVDAPATSIR